MKAIIYTRQSLDKTGEEAGVTRQLKDCRALAKRKKLDVVTELSDNDISATTGVRRPSFESLLQIVENGGADTVIVWHPDRLYRKLTDLVRITEVAKRHGLTIVSVQAGDVDLSTPTGRMVAGILGSVATQEGEHRTERQKNSYKQRAEAGEWHFSRRPFGYKREGGKVVQVPEEAEVLSDVLTRYYAQATPRHAIMRHLNDLGILTPVGKPWGIIQVRDLLTNSRYAGISSYNGLEVGKGSWEPIVDEATWRSWQSGAAKRKRKSTFTAAKYLLTGIARCAECGHVIYVKHRSGSKVSYFCSVKGCVQRSVVRVDEVVESIVLARLQMPDAIESLRPKAAPVEHLYAERADAQSRLDDLAELIADGTLTAQAVRVAAKPLRAKIKRIDEKTAASDTAAAIPLDLLTGDVPDKWAALTLPAKRAVIRALLEVRISRQGNTRVFDPETVAIKWLS
ncbi:recombinase family protein [Cryobacterium sp. MDB2-10]|uniref:recombinase family protein n=1 Tax=Cryobacterium sp. MDB2-10 TaxID=1259177 RepID=UPI0010735F76|nr:recombinase family protein [Cryobacterium sp. MDB2-10]TFC20186.1 recombinase family protein [Cryobacterium sp. MDB2-10]